MNRVFHDRAEAGRRLAAALRTYSGRPDLLVLALPRGGVPIGFEIATVLGAELDVLLVRKLGVPGQKELALGAIASGGIRVLNRRVVEAVGISDQTIERVTQKEGRELERRAQAYRGGCPFPELEDRTVILVDDGLATGSTMLAAAEAVRERRPAELIIAVPVAPPQTVNRLREVADDVICLETPEAFFSIGQWYLDFSQTTDDEVRGLLEQARAGHAA